MLGVFMQENSVQYTCRRPVVTKFAGMVRSVGWRHRLSDHDVDEVMQQVRDRLERG
jgi:hypothetical protein